jgi:hypothetical protein
MRQSWGYNLSRFFFGLKASIDLDSLPARVICIAKGNRIAMAASSDIPASSFSVQMWSLR